MAALTTAEEDAFRRALGELHPCPPATILRAAEKTLCRPEGSLDARQMLVTAFCNAEMPRIDDLKRAVAPPSLAFGDKGLVVTFTPPSGVSHAALYLHVDGDKLFYDGDKKKLLAPGELGNALAARPRRPNKVVVSERGPQGREANHGHRVLPRARRVRLRPGGRPQQLRRRRSALGARRAAGAALHGGWC